MQQRIRLGRLGVAAVIAAVAVSAALAVTPTAGAARQRLAGTSPSASLAKGELLRLSDFPKGWKATTTKSSISSGTTSSTSQVDQIATCEGVSVSRLGRGASAQISLSRPKALQYVFEFVWVFSSASSATKAYRIFASSKAPGCLGPSLAKSISSGGTGNITASSITTARLAFPKEGSATTAFRLGIPVKSTGQTVQVEADVIAIRSGKSVALFVPISIVTGFPTSLAHSLGKKAAARLK